MRSFAGHSFLTMVQQSIAAVTGIVIVRSLDKPDYAHYILALGMASAIAILAEAGVGATVLKLGPSRAGSVAMRDLVRHATGFRRRTTAWACVVVLPLTMTLLLRSGASASLIMLLVVLVAAASFAGAASQMSATLVRLDYRFVWASAVLAISAVARLAATAGVLLLPSSAAVASLLAISSLSSLLEISLLGTLFRNSPASTEPDPALKSEFRLNARRVIPSNAFYLTQGQILTWSLAALGSVTVLAELAALSRFTLLFGLLTSVICNFSTSLFARQTSGSRVLLLLGLAILAYTLIGGAVLGTFWLVPDLYLDLLGNGYAGLSRELLLVNLAGWIAGLTAVLSSLSQGRAWLRWAWIYIPTTVVWLPTLAIVVGISTLEQAAVFVALAPVTGLLAEGVMIASGYRHAFGSRGEARLVER